MYILGISAFYHDSAACLLSDGEIIAAAQEERFSRIKHDDGVPVQAVQYCLHEAGISINDVDQLAFYDKPFIKFERIIKNYLQVSPKGFLPFLRAMKTWGKKKLWLKEWLRRDLGFSGEILFLEHHESHGASAFFPSSFEKAAILTIDGVGEWATTSIGIGEQNQIKMLEEIHYPHSLGLLYSAFTYFCGFKVNSGEYKLMGLAPYGEPVYRDLILGNLIDVKKDGSFALNQKYFNYSSGLTMTNKNFSKLFKGKPRLPESKITQREMDIAASIQLVTEELVLGLAKRAKKLTGAKNICLAGGVALNCVANGKLLKSGLFGDIWIQPAAGDAGGALGAALFAYYQLNQKGGKKPKHNLQKYSYLGPSYTNKQLKNFLTVNGINYETLSVEELPKEISQIIADGSVVGLFQGRMEYGPRALGNRSIIGDARSAGMQEIMNLKIKFRESFRPFAPAVLLEKVDQWFDLKKESPYMLLTADVHRNKLIFTEAKQIGLAKLNQVRSKIPAVTHVDNSARIQTVTAASNSRYFDIIKAFDELTGCPVIINTSFNVRGEPIVCSPKDAYNCFLKTNMDYLLMGDFLLSKENITQTKLAEIQDIRFWDEFSSENIFKNKRFKSFLMSLLFLSLSIFSIGFFHGFYFDKFLGLFLFIMLFGVIFPQGLEFLTIVVAKVLGGVGSLLISIIFGIYYFLVFMPLALTLKSRGYIFLEMGKANSYWKDVSLIKKDYSKQS